MNVATIPKYCITLPEQPKRKERAIAHFKESGLERVTFTPGVNGPVFGLQTAFPYEVDNPGSGFNMGPKCVGIWLSHYQLWFAGSLLPDSHIMIMEDDCKLLPGWKATLEQALQDVPPDFDWLFVGSCSAEGATKRLIKGNVWQVLHPVCFHCYIVAKKALPKLLANTRKCYAPIDIHCVFHSFPGLRVFTILPRIVDQFDTQTDP